MKNSYLNFVCILLFGLSITSCTISGDSNPPNSASSSFYLNNVIDYGIKNGVINIELDGGFLGQGDNIAITCASGASPNYTLLSDSPTQILLSLAPMTDTCSFQVLNWYLGNTSISNPVSLSSTQATLNVNYAYDRGVSGTSANDNLVIYGNFAGAGDQVWASCDGANQFTQAVSESLDTQNEIDFTIPSPTNFNSCQFYVVGNGIQSSTFNVLAIHQAQDQGSNGFNTDLLVLTGLFVGSGDIVSYSCDGSTGFTAAPSLQSDTSSQIEVTIPTPINFASCQFYVQNADVQSNTYSILSVQGAYEIGPDSSIPGNEFFVVDGVFVGSNDMIWAACDGASFTPYTSSVDSPAQLKFSMPAPLDVSTCQLYVQNGDYQTAIYNFANLPVQVPIQTLKMPVKKSL